MGSRMWNKIWEDLKCISRPIKVQAHVQNRLNESPIQFQYLRGVINFQHNVPIFPRDVPRF